MGRGRLREMMVQPLLDVDAIRRRYDGIDLFLRAECQSSVGTVLALLGRVGATDKILLRMQRVNAVPMDFLTLSQTLGCAVGICTTLAGEVREVGEERLVTRKPPQIIIAGGVAGPTTRSSNVRKKRG